MSDIASSSVALSGRVSTPESDTAPVLSLEQVQALLPSVIALADEVGQAIMAIYQNGFSVTAKADDTPVTEADLCADRIITAGLKKLEPSLPVLSEESLIAAYSERIQWPCYWLVDPLDGTREFIRQNDEFTVNIALIAGHHPILGVITQPSTGLCYFAAQGAGAYKQLKGGAAKVIQSRPCPTDSVVVTVNRSQKQNVCLQAFLKEIGSHEVIYRGSSLKSCLVAEGLADVYCRLGPTSEWDTAAAQCIVEEAGGVVADTFNRRLQYNRRETLLNPEFDVSGDPTVDWSVHIKERPC